MLVLRDIKVRYKQTALGAAWVVLRPVLSLAIFTLVFGVLVRVPSEGYPYALFVFSALIPWNFLSGTVSASGNSLVGQAGLIGKVYFPRIVVPIASAGSVLVDTAVSAVFLLLVMPLFGAGWGPRLLAAPFLLVPVFLLAIGVGAFFSALMVAYRDFGGIMGYALQLWMYATPVLYPSSLVPPGWRWLLGLNPMTGLVEGFRSALLGRSFDWPALLFSTLLSAAAFAVGVAYFAKMESRFADII